jgi:hypothetical protein
MKRFSWLALALVVSLALAASAGAQEVFIPNPSVGGGGPQTLVEIHKDANATNQMNTLFIPTEQSGSGQAGSSRSVDNYFRPNVFDLRNYISGPGMVRLVKGGGLDVRDAALFLNQGSETSNWKLPIVSQSSAYRAGEVAYLEGLARSTSGFSNVEIMNLGPTTATCSILLRRPRGSVIGSLQPITLQAVSHRVIQNVLNSMIGVATAGGIHAEVTCNQTFYAYGTFVDPQPLNFRMLYPLDAPPPPVVETVTFNRPGSFFSPVQGNSALSFDLPLVPGRLYRRATVDFDMRISQFSPLFTGVVGLFHTGGPRFNKTLYYGLNIRGERGRTLVDQGQAFIEAALKLTTPFEEQTTYHIQINYDTQAGTLEVIGIKKGAGVVLYALSGAFNLELMDEGGAPVRLNFGLPGVADNAYYPPTGWKFTNLQVRVTR